MIVAGNWRSRSGIGDRDRELPIRADRGRARSKKGGELMRQQNLFRKGELAYGGSLMTKRKGRAGPRPVATRHSMHLVLRSSKAKGAWSFRRKPHAQRITRIVNRFAGKYSVRVISIANVGNHLHLHIQLLHRRFYSTFIRAITSAIAMAVTQKSRWTMKNEEGPLRFWDRRPFSRIVLSFRARLRLEDYIRVNQIEGLGFDRTNAKLILAHEKDHQFDTG